jgi:hypothetical protein
MKLNSNVYIVPINKKDGDTFYLLGIDVIHPVTGEVITLAPQRTNLANIELLRLIEMQSDSL